MKLPGGFDMQEMMKQAQQMQEDMQREMAKLRVEASAGGGVIHVAMNGAKELVDLKIDPEAVNPSSQKGRSRLAQDAQGDRAHC